MCNQNISMISNKGIKKCIHANINFLFDITIKVQVWDLVLQLARVRHPYVVFSIHGFNQTINYCRPYTAAPPAGSRRGHTTTRHCVKGRQRQTMIIHWLN